MGLSNWPQPGGCSCGVTPNHLHCPPTALRVDVAPGFFLAEQNRKLLTNADGSLTARLATHIARYCSIGSLAWARASSAINASNLRFITTVIRFIEINMKVESR